MNSSENYSIAGGWLGTYYYRGADSWQEPTRFEATFAIKADQSQFSGTILDDGPLGEADVEGTQRGRNVHFTKRYRVENDYKIRYEGTMSEDGKVITGKWIVRGSGGTRGTWEAHRLWSPADETQTQDEETSAYAELTLSQASTDTRQI